MHELKNGRDEIGDRMKHRTGRTAAARLLHAAVAAIASAPGLARADWEWNFQTPVSSMAEQIINLHAYIFWICVAIFIGVFGVMFYALDKHRKSGGHQAGQFHGNTGVEIVWTIIPFLILGFMASPATNTVLATHGTTAPDSTIKC